MNLPIIMVEWLDHSSDSAWKSMKEIAESSRPATCFTIGWLVYEDDLVINICNSYIEPDPDEDQVVGGESVILKADIVKREPYPAWRFTV